MFTEITTRVFKDEKSAKKSLKCYKARKYSAYYELDKADEFTKHKEDKHCVVIIKWR